MGESSPLREAHGIAVSESGHHMLGQAAAALAERWPSTGAVHLAISNSSICNYQDRDVLLGTHLHVGTTGVKTSLSTALTTAELRACHGVAGRNSDP